MKKIYTLYFVLLLIGGTCLVSCSDGDSGNGAGLSGGNSGQGGSMARFTINGDILYTVDNQKLRVFDISTPDKPNHLASKEQTVGFNIETIFTQTNDTLLFMGAQDGMYIYNIKDKERPQFLSKATHMMSCDPVVRHGNYAYVTLNSNRFWCGNRSNLLITYDISDPRNPKGIDTIRLENPRGLGVDAVAKKLFVCDNFMRIYDITTPSKPKWVDDFDHLTEVGKIDLYDCIPASGTLFTVGSDGLYQFDYTGAKVTFLSKLIVNK